MRRGMVDFATGQIYGKGISETWVGAASGDRRKEITLATKISTRDGDEAMRETERRLKRLKTDHLDVLHIHNLRKETTLPRSRRRKAYCRLCIACGTRRSRDSSASPATPILSLSNTALDRHDFDCTQMALNAAMQGHYEGYTSRPGHSFESIALPLAKRKNMRILAMKTTGRTNVGSEPGKAVTRDLIRYALSLPISVAVVGIGQLHHVRDNVELARTFTPFNKRDMNTLAERVAAQRVALHGFIRDHDDA